MRTFCFSFKALFLCLFYFSSWPIKAEDRVSVSFLNNDKLIEYSGSLTKEGYLFNRSSDKKVTLATLDWPPYIDESLCDKGWVFQFAVALLVSKNYQVLVKFFPWARAVRETELGKTDILFPEYYIETDAPSDVVSGQKRRQFLALSNPFPGGYIGFMKRTGELHEFTGKLEQLGTKVIGVVRGYQNTPEFDQMMDAGKLNTIEAVDDFQLINMLYAGRVEIIIGDPQVLMFTLRHANIAPEKKQHMLKSLEFVEPPLHYNPLYFALSVKKPHWRDLLTELNQGIAQFINSGQLNDIQLNSKKCQLDHK